MRELCRHCFGIGQVNAERFFDRDISGEPIKGMRLCRNCRGKGSVDYSSLEIRAHQKKVNQLRLRKLIDMGGSAYSDESRFFNITEIREDQISAVYFFPEPLCELLGLIFPGDLEDIEAAITHAHWRPSHGWKVKHRTSDGRHLMRCRAVELQLNQQVRIEEMPEFDLPFERDEREITLLRDLKTDHFLLAHRGTKREHWRQAVEAVKAQTRLDQAA